MRNRHPAPHQPLETQPCLIWPKLLTFQIIPPPLHTVRHPFYTVRPPLYTVRPHLYILSSPLYDVSSH